MVKPPRVPRDEHFFDQNVELWRQHRLASSEGERRRIAGLVTELNHPLVVAMARRYIRQGYASFVGRSFAVEDVVQEGKIGVLDALGKYNPNKGTFANFAVWHIRRRIQDFLYGKAKLVHLPKYQARRLEELEKARAKLVLAGRRPSLSALSAETGLSEAVILNCLSLDGSESSIDSPLRSGGSARAVFLPSGRVGAEEELDFDEMLKKFRKLLGRLPDPKHETILLQRLEGKTAPEIGRSLDPKLGKERVGQILAEHASGKVGDFLRAQGIDPYGFFRLTGRKKQRV